MKRLLYTFALLATLATVALIQDRAEAQSGMQVTGGPEAHRNMLNTYCVGCHNSRLKIGGLAMDSLGLADPTANAGTWEMALKKLRGHLMPPPGSPQPAQADIDAFSNWMSAELDANDDGRTTGYVPPQRLNRTEFVTSVKALLNVEVEEDVLPRDLQVDGFDNIASALTTSPAFLEQYITAARHIAKQAVGDPHPPISSWSYNPEGRTDPAMPFPPGLRGAMRFTHNFPADGEYRLSMAFDERSIGLYNAGLQNRTTQVVMLDGKTVFKGDIGGEEDLWLANVKGTDGWATILERFQKIPVNVLAGKHDIVIGFIDRSHVESDDNVSGGGFGRGSGGAPMANLPAPQNNAIEIKGPYNPTGITNSTTRPLFYTCDPEKIGEIECATEVAANLAHRAYRRPVTQADIDALLDFYKEGRLNNQPFDKGIEEIVAGVLTSPDFLFRTIQANESKAAPNGEYPLNDLELASRLSFFLWNTPPDPELRDLAEAGKLTQPGVVEAQVKRMLADPKAESLVNSFAMKWLNLTSLDQVVPDPQLFRGFNNTLRGDFLMEVREFLSSVLLQDRSVVDLLTSDQTFLNSRLAQHYGIDDGPRTSQFRKVTLTDPARFGLLGKAAVLMRTSYGDRTSPVLRGAWVLDKLIGTPPTPPPPNVVTDLSQKEGEAPKTLRARLEIHREASTCRQCHGVIDPAGLALENFDAIGAYRTMDREANNAPIDAKTTLSSGVDVDGPVELTDALASRPEDFVEALTERLMMYAVNRELEYFDMPQVRQVVRDAKDDNYTFSALVMGIINSNAFRKQGPPSSMPPEETPSNEVVFK